MYVVAFLVPVLVAVIVIPQNAPSEEDPSFVLEVLTEKDYFDPGEVVNLTVRISNIGAEPVSVHYTGLPYLFYSVNDQNGVQLYDVILHCYVMLPVGTDVIGPGETREVDYYGDPTPDPTWYPAWNQKTDGGSQVDQPGYYELVPRLDLVSGAVSHSVHSKWIFIGNAIPLAPAFEFEPTEVLTDTTVTFNASSSRNMAGGTEGLQCRWDWDGDGSYDTNWSTDPVCYHQFFLSGNYTVRLEVSDSIGNTATCHEAVEVTGPDIPEVGSAAALALASLVSLLLIRPKPRDPS